MSLLDTLYPSARVIQASKPRKRSPTECGRIGGLARTAKLSRERIVEICRAAGKARMAALTPQQRKDLWAKALAAKHGKLA